MSASLEDTPSHLAANIKTLREVRALTQQQCAKISGVPRPTWANLESGAANPTLQVLVRVAAALQISIEELIGPPRASAQLYKAGTLPARKKGGCLVRELLPDTIVGMQIERLEMSARSTMRGNPHTPGTREYLVCEQGTVELAAAGERWCLGVGDVVVFRGDQKHSYHNPTDRKAVAYSVISLAR